MLLAHNLQLWGDDVGNAYLQAFTKENLYIVGGPESEELLSKLTCSGIKPLS